MNSNCTNIYALARVNAHYTQDQAAALLFCSRRQLAAWESGKVIPPDDMVCSMIELYQADWLAYQHLQQNTLVGRRHLPAIPVVDMPMAVLRLENEVSEYAGMRSHLFAIAADGQVDDSEKPSWGKIRNQLLHVAGSALGTCYCK